MLDSLNSLIQRELDKLITEVNSYQNESALWLTEDHINNSGGNLALHICGNLQHFIGAILGKTGYIRQRDQEFQQNNVSKLDLIKEIQITSQVIGQVFGQLDPDTVKSNYPIDVFGKEVTTEFFILHLTSHLSYHLGQINYHRRLLDKTL